MAERLVNLGIDGPWDPYVKCPYGCKDWIAKEFATARKQAQSYLERFFDEKTFTRENAFEYLLMQEDVPERAVVDFVKELFLLLEQDR
jgi:hypothetical protein